MQSWCSLTRLWHERRSLEYVDEIFVAFPLNKRRASLFAFCCSRLKKKYFPLLRWNIEELRWQKLLNQSREPNVWTIAIAYPSKNIEIGFLISQRFYQTHASLCKKGIYRVEKGLIYCKNLARRTQKVPWSVMVLPFRVWWHWPIFLQF